MLTRWHAAIAAAILAAASAAALITWHRTAFAQYVINTMLPLSLPGLAYWTYIHVRQMEAHKTTHVAMLSEHTAAKKAHREALTARKITADLYRHWTGTHHPDAPREGQ